MSFSIIFRAKSGRSNSVLDLIVEGNDEVLKKKGNRGDLPKKNVNTCSAAHLVSFSGRKLHKSRSQTSGDLFFFFFLENTPHVMMTCLTDIKV